jgi:hypothetical protein
MIQLIPQPAIEKLKYYVYRLVDPRSNEIFYIGKGEGNRILDHVNGASKITNKSLMSNKQSQILEINNAGLQVKYEIVRHGLTEEQALLIESVLIDFIGQEKLKNEVRGHYSNENGLMSLQEIINKYAAPKINIKHRCILININKKFKLDMSEEEIYKATKQSWIIGKKREQVEVVLATYKGIIRGVYLIDDWYAIDKRWGFNKVDTPVEIKEFYMNHSVDHLINKGNQNPIKYLF